MEYIAHIKDNKIQTLEDHLRGTAELCAKFASEFQNEDWGRVIGLLHDIGKYNSEFQSYIRACNNWDEPENEYQKIKKGPDHSSAGAILSIEKFNTYGKAIAYEIAGHHAGLPDWEHEIGVGGDLKTRLNKKELFEKVRYLLPAGVINRLVKPATRPRFENSTEVHLWLRMLYSCLVDADFLDTENFMDTVKGSIRGNYADLNALESKLKQHLYNLVKKAQPTEVNRIRSEVLSLCKAASEIKPGIFSLTVPTGGGKTLSAMAFALRHANLYDKKRIIMAIPFTSIIEQTAEIYKSIFGQDNVIEHHSNLDIDKENQASKLASENWDAPVIVTTNVQLYESLFAARSSVCRKLHNLNESVIILDEAQTIPTQFLKPIINVMKALVKNFNVTVVFCTATQPVLTGKIGSECNFLEGFSNITEIIPDPHLLSVNLKRVELHTDIKNISEWKDIAEELKEYFQVLCIVNTRKDCRELHKLMPEGTIHLSALMCAEERSLVIKEIKQKLAVGEPIIVISTQLVEAGVDIDFPVVYRALAGLDSIAQAAGRCNREGKLKKAGIVKVFNPPKPAPPGFLRKGQDATKELSVVEFSPECISSYFKLFYSNINSFDEKNICDKLENEAREMQFQFRTAARDFKIIEESGYKNVLIWFNNGKVDSRVLIETLRQLGPERFILRKLQRFSVSVPEKDFSYMIEKGMIEEIHGYYAQCVDKLYLAGIGLSMEFDSELII
jgi:CRISPR-associated endonuclease/helicase Cas3